mgnify:CR=1 FL=1
MTRQLFGALALLVALTCVHVTHADASARARGAATSADRADRVESLAREASQLVRAGEFHRGIARYEEAYRVEPAAALLYNIAFIYDRKLNDSRSAREYYERYLVAPDAEADGSARARDRLADLNAQVASEPEPRVDSSASSSSGAPGGDLRFALVDPPRTQTWGWALLGTGGVALAVGTAFQHMAGASADQANQTLGTDRTILAARVKDQELIGWSVMGLGAACALTGGLLFLMDDEPSDQAGVRLQPVVEPGLAGLSLGARW